MDSPASRPTSWPTGTRALEDNGLIVTEEAPPPVAATLYRLTSTGADLLPSLHSLAGWGEREIARGQGDDQFHAHWLTMPVLNFTDGIDPSDLGAAPSAPGRRRSGRPADRRRGRADRHPDRAALQRTPDVVVTGDTGVILTTLLGPRDDVTTGRTKAAFAVASPS